MNTENFVQNFIDQFDEVPNVDVTEKTKFRELDSWSSLIALSVMAMIDEEYDVQIKADEMRSAETIEDLIKIIESNKG